MILSPEETYVILNTFQIDVIIILYSDRYVHGHEQQHETCSFSNVNLIREGIHMHIRKEDHVDCVDSIRSFLVPVSWYSTDCLCCGSNSVRSLRRIVKRMR